VLFEDETDILLFPPLGAAWSRRGQPAPVVLSGRNARRVVFGTISLTTGHRVLWVSHRQRAEDFQAFSHVLQGHYRGWSVVLLLDRDSSHTAKASQEVARELGMERLWLPLRSPELNAIDHWWRDAKKLVCTNRQYADIDDQAKRFVTYLQGLSPHQAMRKAGMLSKHFWLK
jgi:transposase